MRKFSSQKVSPPGRTGFKNSIISTLISHYLVATVGVFRVEVVAFFASSTISLSVAARYETKTWRVRILQDQSIA